jgi:hypothetical protein
VFVNPPEVSCHFGSALSILYYIVISFVFLLLFLNFVIEIFFLPFSIVS